MAGAGSRPGGSKEAARRQGTGTQRVRRTPSCVRFHIRPPARTSHAFPPTDLARTTAAARWRYRWQPVGFSGPWGTGIRPTSGSRSSALAGVYGNLHTRPSMPDDMPRAMRVDGRRAICRFVRSPGPAGQPPPDVGLDPRDPAARCRSSPVAGFNEPRAAGQTPSRPTSRWCCRQPARQAASPRPQSAPVRHPGHAQRAPDRAPEAAAGPPQQEYRARDQGGLEQAVATSGTSFKR